MSRHVAEIFDDINDQVGFWEDLYLFTLDPHVPKRRFRVRPKKLPWINEEIRDLMKHRDLQSHEIYTRQLVTRLPVRLKDLKPPTSTTFPLLKSIRLAYGNTLSP